VKYEKTPIKKQPVRTKLTKEIERTNLSEYSTYRIVIHLLSKHQIALLYLALAITWAITFARWLDRI
jgi:hypothetical protein